MPWLAGIEKEPLVEIHPEDGKRYGIADGSPVRLITPAGEAKGIAAYDIAGSRALPTSITEVPRETPMN